MCGLFGALSTRLTTGEVENVCELAVMSSLRGMDSTGVAVLYEKKGKIKEHVHKVKGDSIGFLNHSERTAEVLNKTNGIFAILGHCRAATIGDVNETNAHPIEEKHITGCHNGTVHKYAPTKDRQAYETDSRILYRKVANEGLVPTLKDIGEFGAYALTFANYSNRTINFIRNEKRPLWFMFNKARNTLYWASEHGMLALLAERKGGETVFEKPFQIGTGTLWSFKMTEVKPSVTTLDLKPNIVPFVRAPLPTTTTTGGGTTGQHTWRDRAAERLAQRRAEEAAAKQIQAPLPGLGGPPVSALMKPACCSEEAAQEHGSPFHSEPLYRAFLNKAIPAAEAKQIIERGCSSCGTGLTLTSEVYWIGWKDVVCPDCLDDHLAIVDVHCNISKGELVSEA